MPWSKEALLAMLQKKRRSDRRITACFLFCWVGFLLFARLSGEIGNGLFALALVVTVWLLRRLSCNLRAIEEQIRTGSVGIRTGRFRYSGRYSGRARLLFEGEEIEDLFGLMPEEDVPLEIVHTRSPFALLDVRSPAMQGRFSP